MRVNWAMNSKFMLIYVKVLDQLVYRQLSFQTHQSCYIFLKSSHTNNEGREILESSPPKSAHENGEQILYGLTQLLRKLVFRIQPKKE